MKNLPYFFFGVEESYSFSFNYDNSDDRIDDYDTKINNKGDNIKEALSQTCRPVSRSV